MGHTDVRVFICISCRGKDDSAERPGQRLFDAVTASLCAQADCKLDVRPVVCLAVCKRPCTVALVGEGKWTYVVGDLDPEHHAADVIAAASRFAATEDGIVPWRERPQSFRKGVVSRTPPLGFRPNEELP